MPNVRIDELPPASTLSGAEVLPIMQGGATKKAKASDVTRSSAYMITQSAAGAAIEARPLVGTVANGRVIWSLFDAPGTVDGPDDVLSRDIVFNISGTSW